MKRLLATLAASLATLLLLASCGGGSGGGDDSPSPPTPLSLAVSVNGSAATPDTGGSYRVKPGDTVQIVPSQPVNWSTGSSDDNAVTPRNLAASASQWSAQLLNGRQAVQAFSLTAQATATTNGPIVRALFQVAAGDARNSSYQVFATNGTRQTLALDFDTMSYRMTDAAGTVATDTFSADATEPGTWRFKSQRQSTNTLDQAGRFRMTGSALVGTFPFAEPRFVTVVYKMRAFMAAKGFVTSQAALDGPYSQLGLDYKTNGSNSTAASVLIRNGGTQMLRCTDGAHTADQCAAGSSTSYTIAADPAAAGRWIFTNTADASDIGDFMVTTVGGKNVLLSTFSTPAGTLSFRIGLPLTFDWPASTAHAGDTTGSWGTLALDAAQYSYTAAPGANGSLGGRVLDPATNTTTPGIRVIIPGGTLLLRAMQNSPLVVVASDGTSSFETYLQIGTSD